MHSLVAATIAAAALSIAAPSVAATATATAPLSAPAGAFDALTATYRPVGGTLCIRSGWGAATQFSGRLIRRGDCASEREWRRRGIQFDVGAAAARPGRAMQTAAID